MRSWVAMAEVTAALEDFRAAGIRAGHLQALSALQDNIAALTTHEHVDRVLVLRECEQMIRHAHRHAGDDGELPSLVRLLGRVQADLAAVRIVRTILDNPTEGAQT